METTEDVMADLENTEEIDVAETDSETSGEVINVEDSDVDEFVFQDNINTDTDENIIINNNNK